jgi:type III secretory pathway component EscU
MINFPLIVLDLVTVLAVILFIGYIVFCVMCFEADELRKEFKHSKDKGLL